MSLFSSLAQSTKTLYKGVVSTAKAIGSALIPTKEKLSNVVAVEKAALTGKPIEASIPLIGASANKVVGAAASNPYLTAAVVTPANTIGAAKSTFAILPTSAKVGAVIAAPAIVGAVASNPKIVASAAKAPTAIASFGANIGQFTAHPTLSNAVSIWEENPVISTAAVLGTAAVVGAGVSGLVASVANTAAVKENTKAAEKALQTADTKIIDALETMPVTKSTATEALIPLATGTTSSSVPITPATQVVGKSASVTSRRRKRKSSPKQPTVSRQTTNVNIWNQGKSLYTGRCNRC